MVNFSTLQKKKNYTFKILSLINNEGGPEHKNITFLLLTYSSVLRIKWHKLHESRKDRSQYITIFILYYLLLSTEIKLWDSVQLFSVYIH